MMRTRAQASPPSDLNTDTRRVSLSFSSESPIDMGYARETLSHARGAMVIGQRQKNMPLLLNHDASDILGVVENVSIGADRKGRATVRFGKDARGEWAMQQVADGILTNTSFLYRVISTKPDPADDDGYLVTKFEPYELSLVAMPADSSVGVGRSLNTQGNIMETDDIDEQPLTRSQRRALAGAEVSREDGINQERARTAEIAALCERNGVPPDVARRMVSDGTSVADARRAVLEMRSSTPITPVGDASRADMSARSLGISEREMRNYSLFKVVRAISLNDVKAKREAAFEMEVSATLAAKLPNESKGTCIPLEVCDVLGRRGQRTPLFASSSPGSSLVENTLYADGYIQPQYIQPRVLACGATVMAGLVGNILLPRMTTPDQVGWIATEGAAAQNTAPSFTQTQLNPSDVAAYVDISRRLMMQSTPAAESLIRDDLAIQTSVAIDAAAIAGSGTNGIPLGILNQSGIGSTSIAANGGPISYGLLSQMVGQLAAANAYYGQLSWITTGSLAAAMMAKAKFQYGSATLWEPPISKQPLPGEGSILYTPAFMSNNVPSNGTKGSGTNLNTIILANWSDLVVGQWGVLQLLADPYSQSSTGTTRLTCFQTVGIAIRHAASFSVLTDATLN